jgi:hypothetical protein
MKGGVRRILDYTVLDPQIIAMRQQRKTVFEIANALGIAENTVFNRIKKLNIPKPFIVKRKPSVPRQYVPTLDERSTLNDLMNLLVSLKRITHQSSESIVSSALHLINKNKLDIKRVAR